MRTLLGKEYISIKDRLKKQFEIKDPIIEEVVEEVIEEVDDEYIEKKEEIIPIEDKIVDEALRRMGL